MSSSTTRPAYPCQWAHPTTVEYVMAPRVPDPNYTNLKARGLTYEDREVVFRGPPSANSRTWEDARVRQLNRLEQVKPTPPEFANKPFPLDKQSDERRTSLAHICHILQKKTRVAKATDAVLRNLTDGETDFITHDQLRQCFIELTCAFGLASDQGVLARIMTRFSALGTETSKPQGTKRGDAASPDVNLVYDRDTFCCAYLNFLLYLKGCLVDQMKDMRIPLRRDLLLNMARRKLICDRPGDSLEHYLNFHSEAGEGAFATISLAADKSRFGRIVCVKEISKVHLDFHGAQLVDVEIKTMMSLNHPGVVQIYDVYETSASHYLVMEYLKDGTLADFIPRKDTKLPALPEPIIASMVTQILEALSYCHTRGIWHRDLKPSNVMIRDIYTRSTGDSGLPQNAFPWVKLVDFGLCSNQSIAVDDRTRRRTLSAGTRLYQGPEHKSESPVTTASTDVWAVGILAYELFTGIHPYDAIGEIRRDAFKTSDQYLEATTERSRRYYELLLSPNYIPPQRNIPRLAYSFILQLLTYNYRERPRSVDMLVHPWLKCHRIKLEQSYLDELKHNLEIFGRHNFLQVAILNLAAHHISYDTPYGVLLFKEIDEDNDGVVSLPELVHALEHIVGINKQVQIERIARNLDVHRCGYISSTAFIAGCHDFRNDKNLNGLKITFKELDGDRDGYIVADDFSRLLGEDLPKGAIDQMMPCIATDGQGRISWKCFKDFICTEL